MIINRPEASAITSIKPKKLDLLYAFFNAVINKIAYHPGWMHSWRYKEHRHTERSRLIEHYYAPKWF